MKRPNHGHYHCSNASTIRQITNKPKVYKLQFVEFKVGLLFFAHFLLLSHPCSLARPPLIFALKWICIAFSLQRLRVLRYFFFFSPSLHVKLWKQSSAKWARKKKTKWNACWCYGMWWSNFSQMCVEDGSFSSIPRTTISFWMHAMMISMIETTNILKISSHFSLFEVKSSVYLLQQKEKCQQRLTC